MVARVLFPVLTCGGTRSHPQHRATIKDSAGEWKNECNAAGQGQAQPLLYTGGSACQAV